jgi:hypothetical protein
MEETPDTKQERADLLAETLWSLGLIGVVVSIILLLSMFGPR